MSRSNDRHRLAIAAALGLALLCLPAWLYAAGPAGKAAAEKDKVVGLMRRWLCQQPWALAEWNEELGYSQKTWLYERWTYRRSMEWRKDGTGTIAVRRTHSTTKVTETVSEEQFAYTIVNTMARDPAPSMGSVSIGLTGPLTTPEGKGGDRDRAFRIVLRPSLAWYVDGPDGGPRDPFIGLSLRVADAPDGAAKRKPPFPFAEHARVDFRAGMNPDDLERLLREQWLAEVRSGAESRLGAVAGLHDLCRTRATAAEIRDVLARDADPNMRDDEGNPPLIVAARYGANPDVVRALVESGAAINGVDRKGNTALIWAAFNGYREVIKELLKLGADEAIRNNRGSTVRSVWPEYRDGQGMDPALRRMMMQNPPTEP